MEFQSLCVKMALDAVGEAAFDMNLGGLDGFLDNRTSLMNSMFLAISTVFPIKSTWNNTPICSVIVWDVLTLMICGFPSFFIQLPVHCDSW